jgi:hypothetical protein
MGILDKIEDNQFVDESVCDAMRRKYKMAKKDNTGQSLWQKYESELTEIQNFAKKIPGVGSLSELPSGFNQLKHMKVPLVQALWMEKHPVESSSHFLCCCLKTNLAHLTTIFLRNEVGVDYDIPLAVQAQIEETWWLTSPSCKYMLCCLVHKDQGLQGHQHATYRTTDWLHLSHSKGKQQEGIGRQPG